MEKRRINVRAIVWRDGKLLAVKHKNEDGSPAEYWALPGGGLDPMESLQDAVAREIFEELGVHAKVGPLMCTQQFRSKRRDFDEEFELFFKVEDSPAFDSIDLSATSHGADELADVAFVDPRRVPILPEFLGTADLAVLASTKTPVLVANNL